jgi:hypothetical protein
MGWWNIGDKLYLRTLNLIAPFIHLSMCTTFTKPWSFTYIKLSFKFELFITKFSKIISL